MNGNIEQIIALIFSTRKLLHEQKEPKDAKACSFLHFVTLGYVKTHSPLMKDIAGFLGVAPPSATSLINTLSKEGLIARREDAQDRRIVRIVLTKKGAAYAEKHKNHVTKTMRSALEELTLAEQKQLLAILEKITANITK